MRNIAVLLTCHNRKNKTLSCLKSLYNSLEYYNNSQEDKVELTIYLTDDGCSDGTTDAIRESFVGKDINILHGDGNLYWAGGMRFAWNEALKRHSEWDYYLLLNDDTILLPNIINELLSVESFSKDKYRVEAIVTGACCSSEGLHKPTYGGHIFTNRITGRVKHVWANEYPVMCDTTNANVLLIPQYVIDSIGIFYKGYRHGAADYDYTIMARKHHIPVLITVNFCAYCDYDHTSQKDIAKTIISFSLKQRKNYFNNPLHSNKDYLTYVRRNMPLCVPATFLMRKINVYFPRLYYKIKRMY